MKKILLLGDEAIAQGFIDAGGSAINSYPGTPSTQITEYVINSKQAKEQGVIATWCANENTTKISEQTRSIAPFLMVF